MRIIGPHTATIDNVLRAFAAEVTRRAGPAAAPALVAIADEVVRWEWHYADLYRLDAVPLVAQVAHETGWLRFGGRIDARWRNVCGLKIRDPRIVDTHLPGADGDHALRHATFPSWQVGVLAHVQHAARYAGAGGWGGLLPTVDPRADLVGPPVVERWADMGGRWAPAADYGQRIEAVAAGLLTAST